MGADSKIEWTHHTWNLWRGCTEVSPACDHCYARELAKRNPAVLGQWGAGAPRVLAAEAYRKLPLKWNAQAEAAGERRRVFALSMGDWLDEEVPPGWLAELLAMVHLTPGLDWLLLTKRPQNFFARMRAAWDATVKLEPANWIARWVRDGRAPANVWIGTTVENNARADERIPELLRIPARVRFLSCEPLLGPVDLSRYFFGFDPIIGGHRASGYCDMPRVRPDWVIAGGESGHHARPMHPEWARGLRDQCTAARVPFFFKQWGEWVTGACFDSGGETPIAPAGARLMDRVGKKAAGRKLDGREWSEFPTVEEKA